LTKMKLLIYKWVKQHGQSYQSNQNEEWSLQWCIQLKKLWYD